MPFTSKQKFIIGGSLPNVVEKAFSEELVDGAIVRRVVKRVAETRSVHYSMGNTIRRAQLGEPIRSTRTNILSPDRPEILGNEKDSNPTNN